MIACNNWKGGDGFMWLLMVYIGLALFFSFLCSVAEAVLLSVTPAYVGSLEDSRPRSAKILRDLKASIDRPLAAILTLNTIAHTVGAAGAGAQAAVIFGSDSLGVISAILTLLILVFSEIIPKTIGALYWRRLAPVIAHVVRILVWVLLPFVYLSEIITRWLARGASPAVFSRDELAALADLGYQQGELQDKETIILKNLLTLPVLTVENIMTPRTVVLAFPEHMTVREVTTAYPALPFSRIPVYRESLDDVTGFVLKSDIFLAQAQGRGEMPLKQLKRDILVIPATASLVQLFETLLNHRAHIALVVDEYGGVEGVVTLEDLVETLLGLEIVDEADKTVDMRALARSRWKQRARRLGIQEDLEPQ
jgi:CBS domain containing-hemolysin-like protein